MSDFAITFGDSLADEDAAPNMSDGYLLKPQSFGRQPTIIAGDRHREHQHLIGSTSAIECGHPIRQSAPAD